MKSGLRLSSVMCDYDVTNKNKMCPISKSYEKYSNQIKSSLYSPHYAEACNELRGPSPRLSAWATQLRRNVATVASRWRHCADLTGPGIEPQTSRTAIGGEGLGFNSRIGQIGTVSLTTRHRCDVSSELCSPGAKPRRWAPQLVTRFGVISRV